MHRKHNKNPLSIYKNEEFTHHGSFLCKKNKFLCLVHIFQAFTFELASRLINKGRGKNYTSIINNKG